MYIVQILLKGLFLLSVLAETAICIVEVSQLANQPSELCTDEGARDEACTANTDTPTFSNALPLLPLCGLSLITLALFGVAWMRGIRAGSRVWITGDAVCVFLWAVGGIVASIHSISANDQASTVRYPVLALAWVLLVLAVFNLVFDRHQHTRCRDAMSHAEMERRSHIGAPLAKNPPRKIVVTGDAKTAADAYHNHADQTILQNWSASDSNYERWNKDGEGPWDGVIR